MEKHLKEIQDFLSKNLQVSSSLKFEKGQISIKRNLQHFLSFKFSNKTTERLYQTILNYALNAEKMYPGAGVTFLSCVSSGNSFQILNENSTVSSKDELRDELKTKFHLSSEISDLVISALEISGINTKFFIKKSTGNRNAIEKRDGFFFKILNPLNISRDINRCNIIFIDGFIESVSEIHHVLEYFSKNLSCCVLISRGFSNDVLNTIKVNIDRKTIDVIPIIVSFDLDGINTLNDMAVICDSDVISSNKGNLISSIQIDQTAVMDSVHINCQDLVFKQSKNKQRIKNHVSNLLAKIEENPALEEVLSKRMRSLESSCVDIYLVDGIDYFEKSQQIDESLRFMSKIISCGIKRNFKNEIAKQVYDSYSKTFQDLKVIDLQ